MLQEAILIPKHAYTTPFPPVLPYQCPSQLPENSILGYLTPTLEGVWKTSAGEKKQNTTNKNLG